ncbi:MAG: hypothetical protein LUI61_03240 [Firmicutes bacterium]|nr:hypothetical protein [Bacillota bacterium]MCD8003819.1 hypothetical protein [Clostridia bacterium]
MEASEIIAGMTYMRLDAVFPAAPDGSDDGLVDFAVAGAIREVLSLSAYSEIEQCLYEAAADIAAAGFITHALPMRGSPSLASERREGDLTVRYADGHSAGELILSAADEMRRRGVASAVSHRKMIW